MNICEQAEAFRLLLIVGIASKAEIIAWADALILTRDNPPGWLLNLSLAANGDEDVIQSKLRDLPWDADLATGAYLAMDRLAEAYHAGDISPQTAARMLLGWAESAKVGEDARQRAMWPAWIASDVACGDASEQDLLESMDKCLAYFATVQRADR
jgi:hypothetical protein